MSSSEIQPKKTAFELVASCKKQAIPGHVNISRLLPCYKVAAVVSCKNEHTLTVQRYKVAAVVPGRSNSVSALKKTTIKTACSCHPMIRASDNSLNKRFILGSFRIAM
ncbi:fibroblast growth factor receptor-like 1 X4 [Biomphalaria pfeifferi]|uniref:Fibroblast growth factor receptor-like 1 X4 n=1 Tax=Biomphalaria pfeifferi TaxID=112525 RepID=A0AAD8BNT6_BIOPF|nr:fibroblast growth factor receptor-like 1 X4 [Biomphalaria pfeifferi]